MYRIIRIRPRRGGLSSGTIGFRIGQKGTSRVSTGCIGISRRRGRYGMYEVGRGGNQVIRELGIWIKSGYIEIKWGLRYDSLTIIIIRVVRTVSFIVHMYSIEYMKEDPHLVRFITYLSRFTFFMLVLVTGDNRRQRFVGWEGVGVCSYLLINFWYTRLQANKAGIKAMVVNRVGDLGLRLGILRLYNEVGGRDYGRIFSTSPDRVGKTVSIRGIEFEVLNIICGIIRIGVIGKSAQLGLHTWLPDAIEGPTPVSALIHAATMVTAGVYRRVRCSPMYEYGVEVIKIVTRVGGFTARYGGRVGLIQNDRKRVIAYSTCSQLGYMVIVCGISGYEVGRFHLSNHARFKALLFLTAGSVIHGRQDEQDRRRIGGLIRRIPRTYARIRIGSIALMGFPFRTGFYSKDVIRERGFGTYTWNGQRAIRCGTRGGICTGRYSIRVLYYTYRGKVQGYRKVYEGVHEGGNLIRIPLRFRGRGSIIGGWRMKDIRIGRGSGYWGQSIFVHPDTRVRIEGEYIPSRVKLRPVIGSIGGGSRIVIRLSNYKRSKKVNNRKIKGGKMRYTYRNKKIYFDKVYTEWVGMKVIDIGYHSTYKIVDRGVIEMRGPKGISNLGQWVGIKFIKRQSGKIYTYRYIRAIGYMFIRFNLEISDMVSYNKRIRVFRFIILSEKK